MQYHQSWNRTYVGTQRQRILTRPNTRPATKVAPKDTKVVGWALQVALDAIDNLKRRA